MILQCGCETAGRVGEESSKPLIKTLSKHAWTMAIVLVAVPASTQLAAQTAQPGSQTGSPSARPRPAPVRPPADEDDSGGTGANELTVTARPRDYAHQPGAVIGDIKPELQLGPADIQTYGVSSVTELLSELAPETRSDRGRGGGAPVVLLNGRRISGLGEIQNIPTEAILRVDILPEEAALKYGYTADQRVVNIVLRRRFRAITAEAAGGGPSQGDEATGQAELDLLRIRRDDRLNLDLQYKGASGITDGDRSLTPATQALTANAVLAHPMAGGVNATVNATLGATASDSLQENALHQYVNGWTAHLGSTLNKDMHDWRLSLTSGYDHTDSQTDTDVGPGRPQGLARLISDAANIQFLANGPLLKLPAGKLYVSAKAGDTQSWQSARSARLGSFQATSLSRNDANGQLNIDIPLTSRSNRFLPFLGDLSVNANGAIDQLSDDGTLKTFGYGLNWTPIPGYTVIVSHTNDRAAPSIQQLAGATILTPGVRVFDYATGQTVDVAQLAGGNPSLVADTRNVLKVGLTIKPWSSRDLIIVANYNQIAIKNPIATFPAASGPIQAAFPARFIRDENGDLVEQDIRPVNFARSERSEIRWGFNYTRPIGKQPTRADFGRALFGPNGPPRRPPGDDGPRGGGGSGDGGGGRPRFSPSGAFPTAGRLQVAVYHTLYLTDRQLVRPGGPTLDLLNGAPIGNTGGQYRNEIEAQLGMTLAGFGGRLSADWRQGTHVAGVPGSPIGDLSFSDLTTLNLRLFDNFAQQKWAMKRYPWLRGARLSLNIINLLDQRIQAHDAFGATPLGFRPQELDPAGRTIMLSFRKLFF